MKLPVCNFTNKRSHPHDKCFTDNFANFCRTAIIYTYERLLLLVLPWLWVLWTIWFEFSNCRSSHQMFLRKGVNICNLCQGKVAGLRPATLFKKRLWHRCFPVNFVKFLRTPFSQNTSWRLRLKLKTYRTWEMLQGDGRCYVKQKYQLHA